VGNVLIRNLSDETLQKLKSLAKEHGRSLQQELKEVLDRHATTSSSDIAKRASAIRKRLEKKGAKLTDSTKLLREDRRR
jgi:plasmid stability protein